MVETMLTQAHKDLWAAVREDLRVQLGGMYFDRWIAPLKLLTEEGEAKVVVLDIETYYRWKDYLESRKAAGSRPPPIFNKAEAQEEVYRLADDAARRAAGMK